MEKVMAEGAAGATDGTGAAPPPPADTWFSGADQETTGWLQNRGWDKVDAKTAALNAIKSYREAEKHIGAPPDQIIRMPKDSNDKDGWSKLYSRLGVPDKSDAYNFDDVKFSDGASVDQDLVNTVRELAHSNHMTPDAALSVAKTIVNMVEKAEAQETDSYNMKLEQEKQALRTNWGGNAAANLVTAQNAAAKLGITSDELQVLEKTVGYSRVMEMFRQVGSRMSEPGFVNGNQQTSGVMTQQQAAAQLEVLENDSQFKNKLFEGDANALQQFHNLTRIKSGYMG
jgi:hypothetical protein